MADSDHSEQRTRSLVIDAQELADNTRWNYYQQTLSNPLAQSLMFRYIKFRPYSDQVEEIWNEMNLDRLPTLARTTVEVEKEGEGYGSTSTETVLTQQIDALDEDALLAYHEAFDEIAQELGFSATADEATQRTEITDDLIEEVEEWRKQNLEE